VKENSDKPHPTRAFLAALMVEGEARLVTGPMSVVDCHRIPRAELEAVPGFFYCGRNQPRRSDFSGKSPLANPFVEGIDGPRSEAIAAFEAWLHREREGEAKGAWQALAQLPAGAVLGCWCVNKKEAGAGADDCHCDVLARAWKTLQTG
jgi:hypothetical protein